jgi:hypothetical protein
MIRRSTHEDEDDNGVLVTDGERARRRHGRSLRYHDFGHDSEREKHGEGERNTTSPPRVKTEPRMVQRRRVARDGGRLGLRHVSGRYGARMVAAREQDEAEGLGARLI